MDNKKISLVIPVYAAAETLTPLVDCLVGVLEVAGREFEIILVDDASPDNSWPVLLQLKQNYPEVLKIVRLLVNSGQHNAILCGFSLVSGDFIITMDDDLQNPPEEVPKLIEALVQGYDFVSAAYKGKQHAAWRNLGGDFIDRLQRSLFNLESNFQLTSFRAVTREVLDHALPMAGAYPYVTALLLANSSRRTNVMVNHRKREQGRSGYNLRKSFSLASNLIFSYSSLPLLLVAYLCAGVLLFSTLLATWTFGRVLMQGAVVPGWASLMVALSFFNGAIFLCFLIMGVYIMRLYKLQFKVAPGYRIGEIQE